MMMRIGRLHLSLVAVCLAGTATAANGQVTALTIFSRPAPAEVLPGHVVNDLSIDFTGQYTGSLLVVTLTRGSIYQHETLGGHLPPVGALIGIVPALEWDTFVANGGPTAEETVGNFGLGGCAYGEGGSVCRRAFDTRAIDITWNPAGGNSILDRSGFLVARVTFSEDAAGTFRYLAAANQVIGVAGEEEVLLPIYGGVIGAIPEPATVVLLGTGLVALLAVKRRQPGRADFSPEGTTRCQPRVERRER